MRNTPKILSVIGLGQVGACAALLASEAGFDTVGVDSCPKRLAQIERGELGPEPGLRERWKRARIRTSAVPVACDVALICVPTPIDAHRNADLTHVWTAVQQVVAQGVGLLVIESTVPVGTTDAIAHKLGRPVAIAPERILPANALNELATIPRVVGGTTPTVAAQAAAVYRLLSPQIKVEVTCAKTAELCKLAENATRDLQIAWANELESTAVNAGIDPARLFDLINAHPRVQLLQPGPGVGGHCLPVDPWFLVEHHPKTSTLIQQARRINDSRPEQICQRILAFGQGSIGLLGHTYKAETADQRNAPAVHIANTLAKTRTVKVFDPLLDTAQHSLQEVLDCDVVVKLVHHRAFDSIHPQAIDLGPTGRPLQATHG